MGKKEESAFTNNIVGCATWADVVKAFDQLPRPAIRRDYETGEVLQDYQEAWIYRGHESHCYRLEPSIEREYENSEWAEIEYRIRREFQSRARMHMAPSQIPEMDCPISWLATMQHYGAPSRLLDFTFSPYVALYFALRHRKKGIGTHAEVWAIDAVAVGRRAEEISKEADREQEDSSKRPRKQGTLRTLRISTSDFESGLRHAQRRITYWESALRNALDPCNKRKAKFNSEGLIAVALPPTQNLRLSSQQGVFLFNGAQDLTFEESLERMMKGETAKWYKRFRLPEDALLEIEKQLFQMNIHDLSLFPDAEGLAGFVRQRIRLHFKD